MALKPTSGDWKAAATENRHQRNELRSAFFAQTGIKPATSLRNVFLDQESRKMQFEKALAMALENRIGDSNLDQINAAAKAVYTMSGLGLPSFPASFESQPLGILAMSPEVLKAFFSADYDTAFERSVVE